MISGSVFSPDWADGLRIAVSIVQLIVATIVGFAAVQFYRWQQTTKLKEGFINSVAKYHAINQLVISNPDVQDIERKNHFISSDMSREDIVKMFYYFEQLNGIGSVLMMEDGKLVIPASDRGLYHISVVRNIARALYKDRMFIKKHWLPRGYTEIFIAFLDDLWGDIEKELAGTQA